jgi:hypothetical protein
MRPTPIHRSVIVGDWEGRTRKYLATCNDESSSSFRYATMDEALPSAILSRSRCPKGCTEFVQQSCPVVAPERQVQFLDALMGWYKHVLASGTLLYGIACGPMREEP